MSIRDMFLLLLLISNLSLELNKHPVYISVSDIHVQSDRSWSGEIHVFYDDLEDALQNQDKTRPTLTINRIERYKTSIQKYLFHHLLLSSSAGAITYEISGISRIGDLATIQLVGEDQWPKGQIQMENKVFLELFESQRNIVKIHYPSKRQTLYFKKELTSHLVQALVP